MNDFTRLLFIRKVRLLGFGLNEMAEILRMSQHGHSPCPKVREVLEERLHDPRQKIKELKSLQMSMELAAGKWKGMLDGIPNGDSLCYLIEALGSPDLINTSENI